MIRQYGRTSGVRRRRRRGENAARNAPTVTVAPASPSVVRYSSEPAWLRAESSLM